MQQRQPTTLPQRKRRPRRRCSSPRRDGGPAPAKPAAASKPNNTDSGVLEVDVTEDIYGWREFGGLALKDPQDVIEDIYKGFSYKNLIRDEPSPGCEFLLLGDPCKN